MLLKDIQKNVSNVKYSKIWYRVWYVFKKNLNIKWIKRNNYNYNYKNLFYEYYNY